MKKIIKSTTIADRLLFLILLTASVSGILMAREAMSQSSDVTIDIDGRPAYTFPLSIRREVKVNGPCGDTIIEIRDRKVRIREAHCPNLLCVREGWVSRGVIVCLPNRIVVSVGGRSNAPSKDVDAVTG
ncbi:MAG: NusG domain II-containing protein [Nitrospirae bacterium]|nr:NusG domain II-containing protein [Nitrospirota bacterium]